MLAKFGVVAGSVAFALGLAIALGFVPLAVSCVKDCGIGVTPDFTYTVSQLTLTVTDASSHTGAGQITGLSIGWGDGTNSTVPKGSILPLPYPTPFVHTYSAAGNYAVTDTILLTFTGCGRDGCHSTTEPVVGEESVPVGVPTCSTCKHGGNASLNASFSYTRSGLGVSIQDTSSYTGSPLVTSVEVSWGDGAGLRETVLGFSANHTYAAAGQYNVTETVNWEFNGTPESSVNAQQVTVPSQGPPPVGVPSFAWSFLSGALLAGGAATAISSAEGDPRVVAAAAAMGVATGGLVGFLLGGLAWL